MTSGAVVPIAPWMVDRNESPRCGPHGKNQTYDTAARTAPVAALNLAQSSNF